MKVTNKVTEKQRLVYCKDCGSRESWQRNPDPNADWKTESGKIMEYSYRCKICGATTVCPYEPELRIK